MTELATTSTDTVAHLAGQNSSALRDPRVLQERMTARRQEILGETSDFTLWYRTLIRLLPDDGRSLWNLAIINHTATREVDGRHVASAPILEIGDTLTQIMGRDRQMLAEYGEAIHDTHGDPYDDRLYNQFDLLAGRSGASLEKALTDKYFASIAKWNGNESRKPGFRQIIDNADDTTKHMLLQQGINRLTSNDILDTMTLVNFAQYLNEVEDTFLDAREAMGYTQEIAQVYYDNILYICSLLQHNPMYQADAKDIKEKAAVAIRAIKEAYNQKTTAEEPAVDYARLAEQTDLWLSTTGRRDTRVGSFITNVLADHTQAA